MASSDLDRWSARFYFIQHQDSSLNIAKLVEKAGNYDGTTRHSGAKRSNVPIDSVQDAREGQLFGPLLLLTYVI